MLHAANTACSHWCELTPDLAPSSEAKVNMGFHRAGNERRIRREDFPGGDRHAAAEGHRLLRPPMAEEQRHDYDALGGMRSYLHWRPRRRPPCARAGRAGKGEKLGRHAGNPPPSGQ